MKNAHSPTLWRDTDFRKLWIGQTVSEMGSRITREGLPITAALTLGASPMQMALLASLHGLAVLMVGLPVGVWMDRVRRRPVMISADIGRAVLLATIPLAAWRGSLGMLHLYIVSIAAGILTVCFDVAYQTYVPSLVYRERVLEANAKLALSTATAEIAGPATTGILIQLVTAPIAILLDAISFLWSALCVWQVSKPEPMPVPPPAAHIRQEILAGLEYIWGNRSLRALAGRGVTMFLFFGIYATLYLLFALRELHISAGLLGLVIAMGGVGSMIGALIAERLTLYFGLRRTFICSSFTIALTSTLIPLASGPVWRSAAFLAVSQLVGDCSMVIFMTNELSFRQKVTPEDRLGRVNAAMQILGRGMIPIGALAGGAIAGVVGIRGAIAVAAAGIWLSNLWLFLLSRE